MDYVKKLNDALPECIRVVGATPTRIDTGEAIAFSIRATDGHAPMSTFIVKIVPAELQLTCLPGFLDDENGIVAAAMQIKYCAARKAVETYEG